MTTFEMQGREKKAAALVDALETARIDSALAKEIDTNDWNALAKAAGVNPPSIITVQRVIEILADRERNYAQRKALEHQGAK